MGSFRTSRESRLIYGNDYDLCLHYGKFYENGTYEKGYRFTRDVPPSGYLSRQAFIPSLIDIYKLMTLAIENGWGHHVNTISNISNVLNQPTQVLNEAKLNKGNYAICLQYCLFDNDEKGYRFIREENGAYQSSLQARILSFIEIHKLIAQAINAGWAY